MFTEQDEYWMQQAITLAKQAEKNQEVQVGAVLVLGDEAIGFGSNQPIASNDPTAHAEIIAMRAAASKLSNYRLVNSTLYVTLEPCLMCVGALVHARIQRLVFGAFDTKTGAVVSAAKLLDLPYLNHKVAYSGGLLANDCGELLKQFFSARRRINNLDE